MEIYYIVIAVIVFFMIKNISAFFIFSKKLYLGFYLILGVFLLMVVFNQILPRFIGRANIVIDIGDIINVTLISGAAVYFYHYYLEVKVINPVTIFYFYFELTAAFFLVFLTAALENSHLLSAIAHLNVFIYSIIVISIMFIEVFINKSHVNKIRFFAILTMQASFLIMTLFKTLVLPIPVILYAGIFSMVIVMEIEMLFQTKIEEKGEKVLFDLSDLKEKDRMIIELLFRGLEYKEIAVETNLKVNTIKKYINRIYKEYGVKNKTELMNYFLNRK